ncbi:MAG: hypothetical protein WD042_05530, partial [Phycisphaeraceae bacterium]
QMGNSNCRQRGILIVADHWEALRPQWIRDAWIGIFEEYGVRLVHENHEHGYKRTVPIRGNKLDEERGVIYIGDGGWGAPIREAKKADDFWWLSEAKGAHHFFVAVLSADAKTLRVTPVFTGTKGGGTPLELVARESRKLSPALP